MWQQAGIWVHYSTYSTVATYLSILRLLQPNLDKVTIFFWPIETVFLDWMTLCVFPLAHTQGGVGIEKKDPGSIFFFRQLWVD